jgi:hypothetical protein
VNARAQWLVTATLVFSLAGPAAVQAQDEGWTFRGTGEFGTFFSTRDLGKNSTSVSELAALQVSTRIDRSLAWGGGIEAMTPDGRTLFRGIVRSTINGTASAKVALCTILEGALCIDRIADVRHTSVHGEVVFVQGSPGSSFRQNFILGAGVRSYQFSVDACDEGTNQDLFTLCRLVNQIYEDQASVQAFAQFGFGVSFDSGPVALSIRINDMIGAYGGGSGDADGDFQNDVYLVTGVSFRIR